MTESSSPETKSVPQRTVVVTGGGSGIGLATSLRFSASGCRVFTCDLAFNDDAVRQLQAADVDRQHVDVRDVAALAAWIDRAATSTDRLDVLVNNAGVGMVKPVEAVTEDDWDRVLDVNLKALFFASQAAARHMKRQPEGGSIVNIASNAGLLPRSHDPVYSISKQAVIGLTRSLALCLSVDRVRVNAVCPGPVERTAMIEENFVGQHDRQQVVKRLIAASPLARAWGRMMTPEEIAAAVEYLASDAARMVTGTAIAIDGGKSLGVPPAERP